MRRALFAVTFLACGAFEGAPSTPGPPVDPDAGALDASGASDAGSEGTPDADVDAGRFCDSFAPDAGDVIYCRDFDDGRGAEESWDFVTLTPGTSMKLDTSQTKSGPNSLVVRVEPDSVPGVDQCVYARASRKLGKMRA